MPHLQRVERAQEPAAQVPPNLRPALGIDEHQDGLGARRDGACMARRTWTSQCRNPSRLARVPALWCRRQQRNEAEQIESGLTERVMLPGRLPAEAPPAVPWARCAGQHAGPPPARLVTCRLRMVSHSPVEPHNHPSVVSHSYHSCQLCCRRGGESCRAHWKRATCGSVTAYRSARETAEATWHVRSM